MAVKYQLTDPEPWLQAQARNADALADAAMMVGGLDATIGALPKAFREGLISRLAIAEAEEMALAAGQQISRDEIAADIMDARTGSDLDALGFAHWAVRRLSGQAGIRDLRDFLGLHRAGISQNPYAKRLTGQDFDAAAEDFLAKIDGIKSHPFTLAPLARIMWRLAELSPPEKEAEGAVWIARRLAARCHTLPFIPMGRHHRRLMLEGGDPGDRVERQIDAIRLQAEVARGEISGLIRWYDGAVSACGRMKGPGHLKVIEALRNSPLLSAETIAKQTGQSRVTVERTLTKLSDLGVVKEITGGARFRLWRAKTRN